MTLYAIEKEVVEDYLKQFQLPENPALLAFIRAALRRVAEEMFTEVMPVEKPPVEDEDKLWAAHYRGYMEARTAMQQNFIKFTEK